MEKRGIKRRGSAGTASAALVAALLQTAALWLTEGAAAQEGAAVNGYVRTKAGALMDGGDYFIAENTLDLRLSQDMGAAAFYGNAVLYERDGEVLAPDLRELYIDFRGDAFDVRLGKQQIIWGKGDGVFITDLVSPKDLSRFLIPDFEELRLAVTGIKADIFAGYHGLELVWLPYFTPTIGPDADSLWAPALPFPVMPIILETAAVDLALESGEYFLRYSYLGQAFDVSLMGGYFWNDTPVYVLVAPGAPPVLQGEYYRTAAAGYAASGTLGPLVLRSEGALYFGKRFQGELAAHPEGYGKKNALQYLVGLDYSIAAVNLGVQFIQDRILDYESTLLEDEVKSTVTFVVSRSFLRETTTVEVFSYFGLDEGDALIKPKLTWDAADGLEFFAGAYLFIGEAGNYGRYDDLDGYYLGAKLSF